MQKLDFILAEDKNLVKGEPEDGHSIDTLKQIDDITEEDRIKLAQKLILRTAQEMTLHEMLMQRHTDSINILGTSMHTFSDREKLAIEIKMNLELMRNLGIDQLHLTILLRKSVGKNLVTDNADMREALQKVEKQTFEELKDLIVGREIRCSSCERIMIWEGWLPYMGFTTMLPCSCGHQQRIRE